MISVWPSGEDLATAPAAIEPLAPGRFSTRNGLPVCTPSSCAVSRPITSVVPPGGKPTRIFTGWLG
jgi:hypothetical protein